MWCFWKLPSVVHLATVATDTSQLKILIKGCIHVTLVPSKMIEVRFNTDVAVCSGV